jgi:site-specific DNA-methyltransferase (adenine-specific)
MLISEVYNVDCMTYMKTLPDKYFSLCIVDPPYGINIAKNGQVGGGKCAKVNQYSKSEWDNSIPSADYFNQLFRISNNQIIWGGNYMIEFLYNTSCFIVWNKDNTGNFADAELAWTSFDSPTRIFKYRWNGMLQENMQYKEIRIHPVQKPIQLYKWLLKNYAKEGDTIFDSHMGSQSSRIACYDGGFDFVGCELDKDYFDAGNKRFEIFKSQQKLIFK